MVDVDVVDVVVVVVVAAAAAAASSSNNAAIPFLENQSLGPKCNIRRPVPRPSRCVLVGPTKPDAFANDHRPCRCRRWSWYDCVDYYIVLGEGEGGGGKHKHTQGFFPSCDEWFSSSLIRDGFLDLSEMVVTDVKREPTNTAGLKEQS